MDTRKAEIFPKSTAEIIYPSSNNASFSRDGSGFGSCFISASAEGKNSIYGLDVYCGMILTTFTGFLLCLRKFWKRPSKPLVKLSPTWDRILPKRNDLMPIFLLIDESIRCVHYYTEVYTKLY